jgi:hypothetical protein
MAQQHVRRQHFCEVLIEAISLISIAPKAKSTRLLTSLFGIVALNTDHDVEMTANFGSARAGVRVSPRAIASVVAAKRAALSSFKFYQQFKFARFLFISLSNTNLVSSFLGQLLIEDHAARTTIILMTNRKYNVAAGHQIGRQRLHRDLHRLTRSSIDAIRSFPSVRFKPPNLPSRPRIHGQALLSLRHVNEAQDS